MIVDAHIISTYSQYVCVSVVTYLKTREKIEVRKKRKKTKKQNYNKERIVMKSQFEGRKQQK